MQTNLSAQILTPPDNWQCLHSHLSNLGIGLLSCNQWHLVNLNQNLSSAMHFSLYGSKSRGVSQMQLAANNDKLLATPAVKLAPNGIPCITLDLPVQLRGEEHCPGLHPGEVSPKDRILIKQDATFILQDTYRYLQSPTDTYSHLLCFFALIKYI